MGLGSKSFINYTNFPIKKKKILLVPPLVNLLVKKREDEFLPLGLLTLASILRTKHQLKIYEPRFQLVDDEDYRTVAKDILSFKPDIIGFSTWCISYAALLLIAKELKSIRPEIPIIFGGPQASITAKEILTQFPFIDYILKGEADLSLPVLINQIGSKNPQFKTIPGLVFRNGFNEIIENNSARPIQNLDELPIPAYDLFPISKTVKLDIGRGCPFECTYCTTNDFFSKKYRTKSVSRVLEEMLFVNNKIKISSIGFVHDMLTMNKKFVLELCDRLIELRNIKGIEFKWTCSARIDCITNEMLEKMKAAGCESVFFGVESGSPKIQKLIRKNLDIEKSFELADTCRRIGMNMFSSFILGFPEETKSDVEKTLKTLIKLALRGSYVQSSELSLLPGTPLYLSNKDHLKIDGNFSNFSNSLCCTAELELINKYPGLFSSFYYLPVKTLKRGEMVFLNKLINKMNLFRNTIFLLSEIIQEDLETVEIISAVKQTYQQLNPNTGSKIPAVLHWINILSSYINYNRNRVPLHLEDIFNFESYVALILTINSKYRLVHTPKKKERWNNNFKIIPTPIWRILKTKYIIESIIPSKNAWVKNKKNLRKSEYYYLIVATSPIKCKKIRLTKKEVTLLKNLSKLYFTDYVKKVKPIASEKKILLWLKKMKRLGVVEIALK